MRAPAVVCYVVWSAVHAAQAHGIGTKPSLCSVYEQCWDIVADIGTRTLPSRVYPALAVGYQRIRFLLTLIGAIYNFIQLQNVKIFICHVICHVFQFFPHGQR